MKTHNIKIFPEYYEAVKCGDKTFEVRLNDRDYQVNDVLHLQEFNNGEYTGRELVKIISYILNDATYCKEGYVVLALKNHSKCSKVMCPAQRGIADKCTLTPDQCMWFTKELFV